MPKKLLKKLGVSENKYKSCVSKASKTGVNNPYAVCTASFKKGKK